MNVLLLGSGGRENAIAWKLSRSPLLNALFIAPGNAGTADYGQNIAINPLDFEAVKTTTLKYEIDLVIVGPEEPLVRGIVDFFLNDPSLQNTPIIGPSQQGALLEGSKEFGKQFMHKYGIPTASYRSFSKEQLNEGLAYLQKLTPPIVLKADGLAAGKGVLILDDIVQAAQNLSDMLGGKFGDASSKVVIEEFLNGIEFSVFVLTDGATYQLLPIAKDYKRIGENDSGLNTGGMGAVSPVSFVDKDLLEKVKKRIIEPTIKGIGKEKINYTGFIFFGLIAVKGEPYVIEYNCRLGDPETEVVLPRIKNDLLDLLIQTTRGNLGAQSIEITEDYALTTILVSQGYPEEYEKGHEIKGIEEIDEAIVFHAGTKIESNKLITNGGRVLAITGMGGSKSEAKKISIEAAEKILYQGKYYRTDIGFDLE
ncbi:MAG: phosphoribosylamine--glycine ligase [Saprospiraceae bacterium]